MRGREPNADYFHCHNRQPDKTTSAMNRFYSVHGKADRNTIVTHLVMLRSREYSDLPRMRC